jgi:hypothetical protein
MHASSTGKVQIAHVPNLPGAPARHAPPRHSICSCGRCAVSHGQGWPHPTGTAIPCRSTVKQLRPDPNLPSSSLWVMSGWCARLSLSSRLESSQLFSVGDEWVMSGWCARLSLSSRPESSQSFPVGDEWVMSGWCARRTFSSASRSQYHPHTLPRQGTEGVRGVRPDPGLLLWREPCSLARDSGSSRSRERPPITQSQRRELVQGDRRTVVPLEYSEG